MWCLVAGKISNPRRFVVSGSPTAAEAGNNDSREQAQIIAFPGAVDGRFETKAEVDWFGFEVQDEDSLTLRCRSRSLDAASIPVLTVFDTSGREIAHSSGRQREPLLHCRLSGSGTHYIRISERAYRKAAGSFYRLELLTGPQIAAAWPDLIGGNGHSDLTFYGYGLHTPSISGFRRAGNRLMLDGITRAEDWKQTSLTAAWMPAPSPFRVVIPPPLPGTAQNVAGLPRLHLTDQTVTLEQEEHTASLDRTQSLSVPVTLNGRFNTRNDSDRFSFEARKGQRLQFDIYGDRLGHRMDLDAIIMDASGRTLFTFPDAPLDKTRPPVLAQPSLDVSGSWKAAADGTFRLVVRDLYGSSVFGVDRTYVLSLRTPQPSFQVLADPPEEKSPAGHVIPHSGRTAIRISLFRRDGFTEPVRISLSDVSRAAGLTLDDCRIGPGVSSGLAILSFPADRLTPSPVHFLELTAASESSPESFRQVRAVTRLYTGGTQARVMSGLPVSFSSAIPFDVRLTLQEPDVPADGRLKLMIRQILRQGSLKQPVTIEFPGFPAELKSPAITLSTAGTAVELPIPAGLAPGHYCVAARVTGTVIDGSAEKAETADQTPDPDREQVFHVWTNAVSFRVQTAAEKPPSGSR